MVKINLWPSGAIADLLAAAGIHFGAFLTLKLSSCPNFGQFCRYQGFYGENVATFGHHHVVDTLKLMKLPR
jgi:hypothetical protein